MTHVDVGDWASVLGDFVHSNDGFLAVVANTPYGLWFLEDEDDKIACVFESAMDAVRWVYAHLTLTEASEFAVWVGVSDPRRAGYRQMWTVTEGVMCGNASLAQTTRDDLARYLEAQDGIHK